jgi:hypothetical protein
MIILYIVLALLVIGTVLCMAARWYGFGAALFLCFMVLAGYGYPTHRYFLPDDFYLIAVHRNHIWVEAPYGLRAFYYNPVPPEWQAALEANSGPVRLKAKEGEEDWGSDWLLQPREFEVSKEYRMQKPQ